MHNVVESWTVLRWEYTRLADARDKIRNIIWKGTGVRATTDRDLMQNHAVGEDVPRTAVIGIVWCGVSRIRGSRKFSEAEIDDLWKAQFPESDIPRIEVPVGKTVGVEMHHCRGDAECSDRLPSPIPVMFTGIPC
jgi:hypothetical protein